jgi:hypothetical protein
VRVVEPAEEGDRVFDAVDAEVEVVDAAVVDGEACAVGRRVGAPRVEREEGPGVLVGRRQRAALLQHVGGGLRREAVAGLHAQHDEADDEQHGGEVAGDGGQEMATGHRSSGKVDSSQWSVVSRLRVEAVEDFAAMVRCIKFFY